MGLSLGRLDVAADELQQGLVETFGLIQRRGVARVLDHHQAGVGQFAYVGFLETDRRVVAVGGDHQGRAVDACQTLTHTPADDGIQAGKVGALVVLRPALFDLAPQIGLFRFGEEQFAQRLGDGVEAEQARQQPALADFHTVAQRVGFDLGPAVDDGQTLQQLRPVDAELEADHAAHADADQMHLAQSQVLDQRRHIGGEGGDPVALARLVGLAVAAHIQGNHPVVLTQHGSLVLPVADARTQAVNQ